MTAACELKDSIFILLKAVSQTVLLMFPTK